jgi:beta-glucosidase
MLVARLVLTQIAAGHAAQRAQPRPWENPTLPVDRRVELLLAVLTDEEKAAQLSYHTQGGDAHTSGRACAAAGGCGGLRCDAKEYVNASACLDWANTLQQAVRAHSRIFVPVTFFCETTHAGGIQGTTIFPMPVTLGQTWNTSLMQAVGRQIGAQARASGCSQAMSPVLQVASDPRWGRLAENFGECPHLVSQFGLASMRGIMGQANVGPHANASTYISEPHLHPWCQAKHYAGYGQFPRDSFTSSNQVGESTLFEIYLRPWLSVVSNGLRGVMASHNMLQSEPMHGSHHWLTTVLRNRFGLGGGYIGSDSGNVKDLHDKYGVARSDDDAVGLWVDSGGDQAMDRLLESPSLNMSSLIEQGLVSRTSLDRAASNVLRVKFASGIFDAPFTNRSSLPLVDSAAARSLAREAAEAGIVLLQNNHRPATPGELSLGGTNRTTTMLPLPPVLEGLRVAVLGALGGCVSDDPTILCPAKMAFAGGYSDGYGDSTYRYLRIDTITDVLRRRGVKAEFAFGASPDEAADARNITTALRAAAQADFVILAIGDSACPHIHRCSCGEAADRISLEPAGGQLQLLLAVLGDSATLAKTVLVHVGGRPMTWPNNSATSSLFPAILTAMVPGEAGAEAIVSVSVARCGSHTCKYVNAAADILY